MHSVRLICKKIHSWPQLFAMQFNLNCFTCLYFFFSKKSLCTVQFHCLRFEQKIKSMRRNSNRINRAFLSNCRLQISMWIDCKKPVKTWTLQLLTENGNQLTGLFQQIVCNVFISVHIMSFAIKFKWEKTNRRPVTMTMI